MSDLNAIAIVLATLITTTYVALWSLHKIGGLATEIVTGASSGVPLSKEHRSMLMFNILIPIGYSAGFLTLLNAIGMYLLARSVGDSPVRWLAYAASLHQGLSAISWTGGGILFVTMYLKSALDDAGKG